ncbi:hypothetical protein ABKN59_005735 [Abortiporus biennis]
MQTCSTSRLRSSLISCAQQHPHKTLTLCSSKTLRKYTSTVAAAVVQPKHNIAVDEAHNRTLTALHKTTKLLPRILPSSTSVRSKESGPTTLEFWNDLLDTVQDGLSANVQAQAARIVVHSYGEYSGAQDLVTALLEEPFASNELKNAIRERRQLTGVPIRYGYFSRLEAEKGFLSLRSSWLQQFDIPVEIKEVTSLSPTSTSELHSADIPIIVCNPVTTPLTELFNDPSIPFYRSNAILIITSPPGSIEPEEILKTAKLPKTLTVILMDSPRAISALQALAGSNIPAVTEAIKDKLSGTPDLTSLRLQTTLELIEGSLNTCRVALRSAFREVDSVYVNVGRLKDEVAGLKAKVGQEVLGVALDKNNDVKTTGRNNVVKEALDKASVEIKSTMDGLTWWRIVWKVDDIGDTISSAVRRAWCTELEDKLIFNAGRLATLQESFTTLTQKTLCFYSSPSTFSSSILKNSLAQIRSSPTYPVTPFSLTSPIHNRLSQLVYPTNALHRTAQRVTFGMGGSILSGFGVAWAGWAGQLGILGSFGQGMESETALGLGLLGAVAGIRWMVGKWEKAKRKWWKDWNRVGEGLERDLKVALERTVDSQVAIIPDKASQELIILAKKRKEEIDTLKDELLILEDESGIVRSTSTKPFSSHKL